MQTIEYLIILNISLTFSNSFRNIDDLKSIMYILLSVNIMIFDEFEQETHIKSQNHFMKSNKELTLYFFKNNLYKCISFTWNIAFSLSPMHISRRVVPICCGFDGHLKYNVKYILQILYYLGVFFCLFRKIEK